MVYPKAALSWVASDEPFVRIPWLNTLRLRAAYGEAGKQPTAYDALRTYQAVTGPGDGMAVTPLSIGNPDLRPERGKEIEIGFDAAALGDRLSLDLTYYRKRTVDAIVPRELPPSGGMPGVQLINVGEIRNSGIELLARATPWRGEGWTWDLSLNLATNDNVVVSLGDPTLESLPAGEYRAHRAGYPAGSWFERRVVSAEISSMGAVSNVKCDDGRGGGTPCAGADGSYGTADDAPYVYLGRTIPRVTGAAGSTVTLLGRRLRLHALVDFKTGHRKLDLNTYGRCATNVRCRENFFPPSSTRGASRRYPPTAAWWTSRSPTRASPSCASSPPPTRSPTAGQRRFARAARACRSPAASCTPGRATAGSIPRPPTSAARAAGTTGTPSSS